MAVSTRDDRVLDLIFDPNRQEIGFQDENTEEIPCPVSNGEQNGRPQDSDDAVAESKRLELAGIECAEKGDITAAMDQFDRAVVAAPHYASAYNNRAQGRRMQGDTEGAMADLNKAIDLTRSRGKVAEQAYVQRAMIRRLQGDDDGAWQDFRVAAALGSAFAKAEAVRLNPYAAMCNQMLRDVIGKLQRGEE
ncbi:tetratricopeptide repeat protein 36 homolog [Sycon ciliatum]|uniref:tetratricopeptide repeat protein 36 homolog n=1 Tax=Sycon ciliatum TaxID=27933 RepID=UPI0031F6E46F